MYGASEPVRQALLTRHRVNKRRPLPSRPPVSDLPATGAVGGRVEDLLRGSSPDDQARFAGAPAKLGDEPVDMLIDGCFKRGEEVQHSGPVIVEATDRNLRARLRAENLEGSVSRAKDGEPAVACEG